MSLILLVITLIAASLSLISAEKVAMGTADVTIVYDREATTQHRVKIITNGPRGDGATKETNPFHLIISSDKSDGQGTEGDFSIWSSTFLENSDNGRPTLWQHWNFSASPQGTIEGSMVEYDDESLFATFNKIYAWVKVSNWYGSYTLVQPLDIKKGTTLQGTMRPSGIDIVIEGSTRFDEYKFRIHVKSDQGIPLDEYMDETEASVSTDHTDQAASPEDNNQEEDPALEGHCYGTPLDCDTKNVGWCQSQVAQDGNTFRTGCEIEEKDGRRQVCVGVPRACDEFAELSSCIYMGCDWEWHVDSIDNSNNGNDQNGNSNENGNETTAAENRGERQSASEKDESGGNNVAVLTAVVGVICLGISIAVLYRAKHMAASSENTSTSTADVPTTAPVDRVEQPQEDKTDLSV